MSDSEPEPAGLEGLPPLYSISKGEVVSVQTYGAFVRLPGYKKEGLVHVSEMSATRVESAAEIVDVGEKVWIKVIGREFQDKKSHPTELPPEPEVTIAFPARFGPPNVAGFGSVYFLFQINGEKIKLSFSMKAVNQGTGRDLDPNNVMAEQDARRRRQFRDHTGNRITLEAVLNTTCTKCGCKGHFTKDCFSAPGLQYALVPEEGDEELQQPAAAAAQKEKDKKKKKKEKKMKKRKRERKGSDSDDNTSEGSECKPKRRCRERDDAQKHKKKHKKHKSHKRS